MKTFSHLVVRPRLSSEHGTLEAKDRCNTISYTDFAQPENWWGGGRGIVTRVCILNLSFSDFLNSTEKCAIHSYAGVKYVQAEFMIWDSFSNMEIPAITETFIKLSFAVLILFNKYTYPKYVM